MKSEKILITKFLQLCRSAEKYKGDDEGNFLCQEKLVFSSVETYVKFQIKPSDS